MAGNIYWEEIERYFSKKRGNALILSPKDWPLVTSWQERGIPLELIYEGIDKAFARLEEHQNPAQRRTIRTLTYCKYDIEELWKAWEGIEPETPRPSLEEPGRRVVAEKQKLVTKLRSVASQLQKTAQNPQYDCVQDYLLASANTLEQRMAEIDDIEDEAALLRIKQKIHEDEQQLIGWLEQAIDSETRRRLLEQAENRLASHKQNMKENAYQETLRIAFLQLLRDTYPLPSFL